MILSSIATLLFAVAALTYCSGLEVRTLEVPRLARLHRPATLGCRFRLGPGHRLHSVKWYKDAEEFYRFSPSERPATRVFPVPGAQVEVENSDLHLVTLKNVSIVSAGVYECEVSSDGPDFATVQAKAKLDVYSLPERYPEIKMDRTSLHSGEKLNASCSSGKSYPKQTLSWFLNGIKVNSSCITWEGWSGTGSGLIRSYSNVSVGTSGGPGPILLSCVATLDPLISTLRDQVDVSLLREPSNQPLMDSAKGVPSHNWLSQFLFMIAYSVLYFLTNP